MSDLDKQAVVAVLIDVLERGRYLLPGEVLSDAAYALYLLYKTSEQKEGA